MGARVLINGTWYNKANSVGWVQLHGCESSFGMIKGRDIMGVRFQSTVMLAILALVPATGAAMAHHSFAMFDAQHPIELSGTVKEFRFISPHTILIISVTGEDGVARDWVLEGGAPGMLVRDGMTAKSLKPGDQIKVIVNPLHSGANGGSYQPFQVNSWMAVQWQSPNSGLIGELPIAERAAFAPLTR
jgi:hypothetical protein